MSILAQNLYTSLFLRKYVIHSIIIPITETPEITKNTVPEYTASVNLYMLKPAKLTTISPKIWINDKIPNTAPYSFEEVKFAKHERIAGGETE